MPHCSSTSKSPVCLSQIHIHVSFIVCRLTSCRSYFPSNFLTCVRLLGVAWPVCNMFDVHKIETKVPCQIAHLPSTAVDMMRPWNCFGMSLCILYWTWFGPFDSVFSPVVNCCSLITYCLCVFGFRRQAEVFYLIFISHSYPRRETSKKNQDIQGCQESNMSTLNLL